jgi:hypothetical protein
MHFKRDIALALILGGILSVPGKACGEIQYVPTSATIPTGWVITDYQNQQYIIKHVDCEPCGQTEIVLNSSPVPTDWIRSDFIAPHYYVIKNVSCATFGQSERCLHDGHIPSYWVETQDDGHYYYILCVRNAPHNQIEDVLQSSPIPKGWVQIGTNGSLITIQNTNYPYSVTAQIDKPAADAVVIAKTAVAFKGSATDTNPTATFTYAWNFGDGTTATGAAPSHAFILASGTPVARTVVLKVTDNAGYSDTVSRKITVKPAPPVITAAAVTTEGVTGWKASVAAVAKAIYAWEIDGGTITAGANSREITYSAGAPGTLTLTCTVTVSGYANTGTKKVKVVPAPDATITAVSPVVSKIGGYHASVPSPQASATYAWRIVGGTITAGVNTSRITYQAGPVGTLTLGCTVATPGMKNKGTASVAVIPPVPPQITTQPTDQTVTAPTIATFHGEASGNPLPTYQWQTSSNGGSSWTNVVAGTGANSSDYKTPATSLPMNGRKYRLVARNVFGQTAFSDPVALTVNAAPVITSQPVGKTVTSPATATFTVSATGNPAPSYQWQVLTKGGSVWNDVTDGTEATAAQYTTAATTLDFHGRKYRVIVSNGIGASATSTAALLNVNVAPQITSQPADQAVTPPASVTFTVAATGNPAPSYQWQCSKNGGTTWANVTFGAGGTTPQFTIVHSSATIIGWQFRAVAKNGIGTPAISAAANLTLSAAPAITAQPVSVTVTASNEAVFNVAASGSPVPSFQWQISENGGGAWSDVAFGSGATSNHFSIGTTTPDLSGCQFRAKAINALGTAISQAASLTVNPAAGAYLFPVPLDHLTTRAELLALVTGTTYYLDAINGSDATGDGSSTLPWKTLGKVHTVLQSGDCVVLRTGDYGLFDQKTVRSAPTLYIADTGHIPVLTGVWLRDDDAPSHTPGDPETAWKTNLVFHGIHIVPSYVDPGSADSMDPNATQSTYAKCSAAVDLKWYGAIRFIDCSMSPADSYGASKKYLSPEAMSLADAPDVWIERCEIDAFGAGISYASSPRLKVYYSKIHGIASSHVSCKDTHCSDSVIEGNHLYDANWDLAEPYCPRTDRYSGSFVDVRSSGTVVRNNLMHAGSNASGVMLSSDSGIAFDNILIEGNAIYDSNNFEVVQLHNVNQNVVVRNNTLIGRGKYGSSDEFKYNTALAVHSLSGAATGKRLSLTNNVFAGRLVLPGSLEQIDLPGNIAYSATQALPSGNLLAYATGSTCFESGFFAGALDVSWQNWENDGAGYANPHGHCKLLDLRLVAGSPALVYGVADSGAPTRIVGLNTNGFLDLAVVRSPGEHSAGAMEVAGP